MSVHFVKIWSGVHFVYSFVCILCFNKMFKNLKKQTEGKTALDSSHVYGLYPKVPNGTECLWSCPDYGTSLIIYHYLLYISYSAMQCYLQFLIQLWVWHWCYSLVVVRKEDGCLLIHPSDPCKLNSVSNNKQ